MTLEQYLIVIADKKQPLHHTELLHLSGMTPQELDLVRREWKNIQPQRRRDILKRLVEMAEDNVELDFNDLFRFCLTDDDPEVRAKAIEGLWECDDRVLITPLTTLLRGDSSEKVRAAAAMTLGKFATLAQSGKMLSKDGKKINEALIRAIRDPLEYPEVTRRAIEAIAPFDTPEVHQIIKEAYSSKHAEMRSSAVYAMGKSCNPQWLPVILNELRNPEPAMRYEAANACSELGDEAAVPYLIPLLKDEDPQAQASAIAAMGNIGGSLAQRALLRCLKSSDELVVEAAQEALSKLDAAEGL